MANYNLGNDWITLNQEQLKS